MSTSNLCLEVYSDNFEAIESKPFDINISNNKCDLNLDLCVNILTYKIFFGRVVNSNNCGVEGISINLYKYVCDYGTYNKKLITCTVSDCNGYFNISVKSTCKTDSLKLEIVDSCIEF